MAQFLTVAGGIFQYMGARQEADMIEQEAKQVEAQGVFERQVEINDAVQETAAIEHQKGIVELNRNIAAQEAADTQEKMEQKAKEDQAKLLLSSDASVNKFSDVFKMQANKDFDSLVDFSFKNSQDSYQSFIQSREIDRQAGYTYSQGLAKADYTKYKFDNQAITLRRQADAKRTSALGSLFGTFASAANMGD